MSIDLVPEHGEGARDETCRTVRVTAGAAALDLRGPALEAGDVRRVASTARGETLQRTGDRGETVDAGATLPGALVTEIARHACRLGQAAHALREGVDRTRAQRCPCLSELGVGEPERQGAGSGDPVAEVAADDNAREPRRLYNGQLYNLAQVEAVMNLMLTHAETGGA